MDTRTGLPVVGMVGGGQLARMTHQAAIALGQSLRLLAATPDDGAALVCADLRIGQHTDLDALRAFAQGCDVITFDHEHVPVAHLEALAAKGVVVRPGPAALRHAQDKLLMRTRLAALGFPVPRFAAVHELADLVRFAEQVGWPVVAKAVRGGYDGRGVWVVPAEPGARALVQGGATLLVEELVGLRRELAAVVARSPFGQVAAYPVVQTVQQDGICVQVIAPAPDLEPELAAHAQELAIGIAAELDVVGLLAVELFDTGSGLMVNELAMRPHNSGHWTIDGAHTSQFEQHLRAVLDYPLGDPAARVPVTVMANVLGGPAEGMTLDERLHHVWAADPAIKVHLYGKQVRPGRKIGHVTAVGDQLEPVRARATAAAQLLHDGAARTHRGAHD